MVFSSWCFSLSEADVSPLGMGDEDSPCSVVTSASSDLDILTQRVHRRASGSSGATVCPESTDQAPPGRGMAELASPPFKGRVLSWQQAITCSTEARLPRCGC